METHGVEFNVTPLYFGGSPYIVSVSNLGRETWLFGVEFLSLPSLVWKDFDPDWISYAYSLFCHSAASIRTKSQIVDSVYWLELYNLTRDCRGYCESSPWCLLKEQYQYSTCTGNVWNQATYVCMWAWEKGWMCVSHMQCMRLDRPGTATFIQWWL